MGVSWRTRKQCFGSKVLHEIVAALLFSFLLRGAHPCPAANAGRVVGSTAPQSTRIVDRSLCPVWSEDFTLHDDFALVDQDESVGPCLSLRSFA